MSANPALKRSNASAGSARPEPGKSRAGKDQRGSQGPLWLAIYLPRLSLEALCRGENLNRPSVAVADDSVRARVIAVDRRAEEAGIRTGMSFSAACALAPALIRLRQDKEEESAAVEGLAAWSGQYTSFVSVEQQGLLLEVGGSLKLFGGLDALCAEIKTGVHALGYTTSMGVAPTPAGAWLLARAAFDAPVVSPALLSGRLAPVPVECMDLPGTALGDLRRMGVRNFGDCCRLPRDGLARRLTPRLVELLDRALGRRSDPRLPYVPPLLFERCIHFAFEIRDSVALLAAAAYRIWRYILPTGARLQHVLACRSQRRDVIPINCCPCWRRA